MSVIFSIGFATAACNFNVSLLNQDPYPAVPGDYVSLVFQINVLQDSSCSGLVFQLVPQYPISFDPNASSEVTFGAGAFQDNYKTNLIVPYKVRLDQNAIDGDNTIITRYSIPGSPSDSFFTSQFNLNVKDSRTIFEAFVKNFDSTTNKLTIQILNSGKSDVDALTIEIPEQTGVVVKGSNRNIIGSLDANEYTTVDFEVSPAEADITLNIYYTDKISVRRTTNTIVHFDPSYFENRKSDKKSSSSLIWIIVIIAVIVFLLIRRSRRIRHKKLHSSSLHSFK